MKKTAALFAALLMLACHRGASGKGDQRVTTQTIAPAAAKPDNTGSADQMTQTVDVDDSRSEEDGGVTSPGGAPAKPEPAKTPAKRKHK